MDKKISFSSYLMIGVMLFALFFGAGNLIFPAELGQQAGTNLWLALAGFLITGVGLPFLGILAIGYSGSDNLQHLASRVHPVYAVIFTSLLYLTIGPFFAAPRTGAVAFDITIMPFIGEGSIQLASIIFTMIFFGITLWLSLNPAKIVDRVGKILSPGIIVLIIALLLVVIIRPLSAIQEPTTSYLSNSFFTGFTEGYNTMDALASLVFGIIVINVIRGMGITSKQGILKATARTGIVAVFFLAIIYSGIAYLGATSAGKFGVLETGGQVLSQTAAYYFGTAGHILLGIVITLACLTTAIGLMIACGEYFHTIIPKVSYKQFVTLFTTFCFVVANFGLSNIITYSVPLLMFIYPLAIVLMLLAFTSPLFNHAKFVYVSATIVTFMISIVDGYQALTKSLELEIFSWVQPIITFYENSLPLYEHGLGWLVPVIITIIVTGIISRVKAVKIVHVT